MSSVLTMMVAGGGVLIAGGTVKMVGMQACVTVPMDDSAVVPARRKCGNPAIHMGHHGSDLGILSATCF
jgi:hypothetical protein